MAQPTILLAGAAGDLGARIAKALIARGAAVRALVRHDVSAADRDRLAGVGVAVAPVDHSNTNLVAVACAGATCVVSALNGLHDVIVSRQGGAINGRSFGAWVEQFLAPTLANGDVIADNPPATRSPAFAKPSRHAARP